jgi:signal transduction histidine kinase
MVPSPPPDRILVVADDALAGRPLVDVLARAGIDAVWEAALDGDFRRWAAILVLLEGREDALERLEGVVGRVAGDASVIAVGIHPEQLGEALSLGAAEAVAFGATESELIQRAKNALRRADGRSQLSRGELEGLLDIAEAATSHLELEELLRVVVARIAAVVPVERCSAILLEGEDQAIVMASHDVPGLRRLRIDLHRYPELREAVQSRAPVLIDDLHTHPLMEAVRPLVSALPEASLVVAPLVAHGDAYGVLYLRLARGRDFGPHEQVFVRAAASAVANSVRNARLHTSVREKRDELEEAYQEKFEELGRLNEQLREANRIKDELLAVCSHDVRAPLNVLLGHVRLLQMKAEVPTQRHSLEAIERQGLRVLQLVQQILEKGRGQHGLLAYSFERIDLGALARLVAEDLGTLEERRGVSVVADVADVSAEADASAIRQGVSRVQARSVSPGAKSSAR